jgi:hypothetical protein
MCIKKINKKVFSKSYVFLYIKNDMNILWKTFLEKGKKKEQLLQ